MKGEDMMRTTCTLDFATTNFDGPCRLLLDDEVFVEGTGAECVPALDRLIDPYVDPFRVKIAGRKAVIAVARTKAQRVAGMSSIIEWTG